MDENGLTETTESIEKAGRGVIRWTVLGILILFVFAVISWILLYSNFLANDTLIIPIRNWYQDTYWKVIGNPPYSIQAQMPLVGGSYTYTFIGSYSKLDLTDDYNIVLKDKNGNLYTFRINTAILKDKDEWLKIFQIPNRHDLAIGVDPIVNTNPPKGSIQFLNARQTLLKEGQPAVAPTTIAVRWNDSRTLPQILSDYSKSKGTPLNDGSPESTILAEFK